MLSGSPWQCLNTLLSSRQREILVREESNDRFIYMYDIGGWWSAFEQSAFLLQKIFPDGNLSVLHLKTFPFPVVMISVPGNVVPKLDRFCPDRACVQSCEDCKVLSVAGASGLCGGTSVPVSAEDYSRWRREILEDDL